MGLRHRCGLLIPLTADRWGQRGPSGRRGWGVHKKIIISLVIEMLMGFEEEYTPGKNRNWSLVAKASLSCACDSPFYKERL